MFNKSEKLPNTNRTKTANTSPTEAEDPFEKSNIECSQKAIEDAKVVLSHFDCDGNGSVGAGDLANKMKEHGYPLKEADARLIINSLDQNSNGELQYEEFYILIQLTKPEWEDDENMPEDLRLWKAKMEIPPVKDICKNIWLVNQKRIGSLEEEKQTDHIVGRLDQSGDYDDEHLEIEFGKEVVADARNAFNYYDKDGDGFINNEEFVSMVNFIKRRTGFLIQGITTWDTNGDGKIDFLEYLRTFPRRSTSRQPMRSKGSTTE